MKIKYPLLLLITASLLLVQCKKEVAGCKDDNAFNYDPDADINCCCEYEVTFDPEGTANSYSVTWINESGSTSTLPSINNSWQVMYVVTIGASVSFSITNTSTDSLSTAKANIWLGNDIFKTTEVTGIGETATASGIVN